MCDEQYRFHFWPASICAGAPRNGIDSLEYFILGVCIERRGLRFSGHYRSDFCSKKQTAKTYRFIKKKEMNLWLVCPHECTSEGNTLPLKTWRRRVHVNTRKEAILQSERTSPPDRPWDAQDARLPHAPIPPGEYDMESSPKASNRVLMPCGSERTI
jgi:hypothetical protein